MLRDRTAFAGSLRNASAVAAAAQDAAAESIRKRIAVIAAGEHWPGGNLRPAIEDLLGAGAIIERLQGRPSPEARAARAAYRELKDEIPAVLSGCPSGQARSEEHTSELQSLMRISYAVFCLKNKTSRKRLKE